MSHSFAHVQAALLLLAVLGCGGPEERERQPVPPPSDPVWVEVAQQCLGLLGEYRETDFNTATEAELDREMREAELNDALCSEAFRSGYRGPGGAVMASHLANELRLHSLKAELTLSERFDQMAGYCAILEELLGLLGSDARELGEALQEASDGRSDLSTRDLQALLSLANLSQQAIEVLLFNYQSTCR